MVKLVHDTYDFTLWYDQMTPGNSLRRGSLGGVVAYQATCVSTYQVNIHSGNYWNLRLSY